MAQKRLSDATKKRLKAGRMLLAGKGCSDVAKAVGVARQTDIRGKGCSMKVASMPFAPCQKEAARPSSMSSSWRRCEQLSAQSDRVGFGTELWTLKRVGAVIERLHGVRFGQTQVWRILGSLGFSPQKPEKRAIERNEDAGAVGSAAPGPA